MKDFWWSRISRAEKNREGGSLKKIFAKTESVKETKVDSILLDAPYFL
jgi:hypothetical protein